MKLKSILLSVFFILTISMLNAQPPGDPGGDPDDVPIDGGIGLLLAAGALYGARKMYKEKPNA